MFSFHSFSSLSLALFYTEHSVCPTLYTACVKSDSQHWDQSPPATHSECHIKSLRSQEPFPAYSKSNLHKTNPLTSYKSDLCAVSTLERNLPRSVQSCLFDVHEHPWREQLVQPHKAQFWWIRKQVLSNIETTDKNCTVLHLTATHYLTSSWRSTCILSLGNSGVTQMRLMFTAIF